MQHNLIQDLTIGLKLIPNIKYTHEEDIQFEESEDYTFGMDEIKQLFQTATKTEILRISFGLLNSSLNATSKYAFDLVMDFIQHVSF
mmetsp:Transcript_38825/g.44423  ORF Transcript_38825/g.44423 Transcript_38825/m.44423 type:complete len:87 (-) Transcript_38825:228-488(-)